MKTTILILALLFGLSLQAQNKLDVVFVSQGYSKTQLKTLFVTHVEKVKSTFLSYEPFKSRQSQVAFTSIPTTKGLRCRTTNTQLRPCVYCDESMTYSMALAANPSTDIIIVLVLGKTGGCGGGIAVVGTGSGDTNDIFVDNALTGTVFHEVGHMFGGLWDECQEGTTVPAQKVNLNCYEMRPPPYPAEWSTTVGKEDFVPGCLYNNWASAGYSIMKSNSYKWYNIVSQGIINKKIDMITGPFYDFVSPVINLISPTENYQCKYGSTFHINANAVDNISVTRICIYVDGLFLATRHGSTFQYSFYYGHPLGDTKPLSVGNHIIMLRAYDNYGNFTDKNINVVVL